MATWETENKIYCKQTLLSSDGPKTFWSRELRGDELELVSSLSPFKPKAVRAGGGVVNPCFRPTLIRGAVVFVGKVNAPPPSAEGRSRAFAFQSQQISEQMSGRTAGFGSCQKQNKGLGEGRACSEHQKLNIPPAEASSFHCGDKRTVKTSL